MIARHFLSDSNEDARIRLHDLPVQLADTKPVVIDCDSLFDGIANTVNHVDRIATVGWFLNENIDPDLSLNEWLITAHGHPYGILNGGTNRLVFVTHEHIVRTTSHAPH